MDDTQELLARIGSSSVDAATLDGLRITVERLCSQYPFMPADQLLTEGKAWLRRMITLLDRKLTLNQHRDILATAAWLAALVGCVEYDSANHDAAEENRKTAWNLGEESGNADVMAWSQEMRAWFALTRGDYPAVLDAAETGLSVAPRTNAAVQLHAQKAKAWARLGDRRQVETALDRGRAVLEQLPYPENLHNHFVVDPAKQDSYAMDCYRILGSTDSAGTDNKLAAAYATEILRTGIDSAGFELSPMRNAEARITLAVIAARQGDLEQALDYGRQAISGQRLSAPSLLTVSSELAAIISDRYPGNPDATSYLDQLRQLRHPAA
jgi:tetratricopeptide (TPR) repeat protein